MNRFYKYWKITFLILIVLLVFSFFVKDTLPDYKEIDTSLLKEPLQTTTSKSDFTFTYKNKEYFVHPVYDYELWGLVVSHNDINSIFDSYHDKNSVDIKDLCVIWGSPNLTSNDFHDVKYWNISWSCNWQYLQGINFSSRELSNNHLLSDNKIIRDKIKNVHIGDQIHIKGSLVNYEYDNYYPRISSISRDDTGNHACEVIYVDEFEFIKRSPMFIFAEIWEKGGFIIFFLLFIRIITFFIDKKT